MSRRDDRTLLQDMLDAASAAVAAIQGRCSEDLPANPVWALGLVKCLEIVGEAAGRLSPAARVRAAEIQWPQIIAMRNRLVHGYFEIDYVQVWRAVTEDLPILIDQLKMYVGQTPESPE